MRTAVVLVTLALLAAPAASAAALPDPDEVRGDLRDCLTTLHEPGDPSLPAQLAGAAVCFVQRTV